MIFLSVVLFNFEIKQNNRFLVFSFSLFHSVACTVVHSFCDGQIQHFFSHVSIACSFKLSSHTTLLVGRDCYTRCGNCYISLHLYAFPA